MQYSIVTKKKLSSRFPKFPIFLKQNENMPLGDRRRPGYHMQQNIHAQATTLT